jgi:hypothetical protein
MSFWVGRRLATASRLGLPTDCHSNLRAFS